MSTMSPKLLTGTFRKRMRRRRLSLTAPHTSGLKSLRLRGDFGGHPNIPPDSIMELTHITVDSHYLPSLAFFDSILPAAPFLTSLELGVTRNGLLFPTEYTSPFQAIAHHLRHLTLYTGFLRHPASRASLNVTRFVASCTSLKSLAVRTCGTAYFGDVAATTRAPLCVLETQLAAGWNEGGTGVAELASVLELPAMATLKRWRLSDYTSGKFSLNAEEKAQWEAVCRTRGVEPRDQTLFFTGKVVSPSFSSSFRALLTSSYFHRPPCRVANRSSREK
jgi:hypothetical protein